MVSGSQVVATAESGDVIITDISFGANDNGSWRADFTFADATLLAAFRGHVLHIINLERSLECGVRVPEGEELSLVWASSGGASNFAYTLSGYYAQP